MEIAVPIVMVVIVGVVILIRRREHLEEAHSHLKVALAEKREWDEQKLMSAGEVNGVRTALTSDIQAKFSDGGEKDLLMKIVDEWAELKMKSFADRRSWVRTPDSED